MSTIAITGATGQLGRLVIAELLGRGAPAAELVAIARTPAKAADLAAKGVEVREGDYSRPETLPAALAGVQTLLLISSSEVGRRVPQHTAVIDAAKAAGVARIVYTSVLRADTTDLPVAPEHKATEAALRASGVTSTVLRNGWYIENYTRHLAQYLERGEILGAAGSGRIAAAARADYAAAAATVLLGDGHDNAVYELGGTPFTLSDLAATVSEVTGANVVHRNVSGADLGAALQADGLDPGVAGFFVAVDASASRGGLDTDDADLRRLIGRPSTPLADAVRAAKV